MLLVGVGVGLGTSVGVFVTVGVDVTLAVRDAVAVGVAGTLELPPPHAASIAQPAATLMRKRKLH